MKKVFIYNIGQNETVKPIKAIIEKQGFEVIVGPSQQDQDFLMTIPYYKESFDQKIYSFCSDVYRSYVLSNNKGLYIDTSVIVGPEFYKFYEEVEKYKAWLPRTSDAAINNCIAFGNHSSFMKEALDFYIDKYTPNSGVRQFPILPRIVTLLAMQKGFIQKNDWTHKGNEEVYLGELLKIRDANTIKKLGGGSWFPGKSNVTKRGLKAQKGWQKMENRYRKQKSEIIYRRLMYKLYKKYFS